MQCPRPLTVLHAVNARFRLSALNKSQGVYIQNMSQGSFTFLSPAEATGPLGHIAIENRRQLAKQSTEGQALAFLNEQRTQLATRNAIVLICGPSNAMHLLFTNWTKADIYRTLNFVPAVVRSGVSSDGRKIPPGTPIYYHVSSTQRSAVRSALMRNTFVVLGKDHDNNYWMSAHLSPHAWAIVEQALKQI